MPTFSPHSAALWIVLAIALVGAIVAFVRDRSRFRGYEDLTREALRLAGTLKGATFRDGADLVSSGSWNDLPVQVRFSHAIDTPGVEIRMGAPAGFTFSIMPANSNMPVVGRVRVRIKDENFSTRFLVRSDDPLQARFLADDGDAMECFRGLCQ